MGEGREGRKVRKGRGKGDDEGVRGERDEEERGRV